MRRILHIVPGLDDRGNGIAVAAKRLAAVQGADLVDARTAVDTARLGGYDEVWVHSMWTPQVRRACRRVLKAGVPLVRMPHGCTDPVRLAYHGWKKRLVGPLERRLFARTSRVVATCPEESDWIRAYAGDVPVEVIDLKPLWPAEKAMADSVREDEERALRVLYLGRRHPLKGVDCLVRAVAEHNRKADGKVRKIDLRIESAAFDAAKEAAFAWCDVLCLPTLSENFGIVVAEARARGRRVIVTDGAPAWKALGPDEGIYIEGFRTGSRSERLALLAAALVRETEVFSQKVARETQG